MIILFLETYQISDKSISRDKSLFSNHLMCEVADCAHDSTFHKYRCSLVFVCCVVPDRLASD